MFYSSILSLCIYDFITSQLWTTQRKIDWRWTHINLRWLLILLLLLLLFCCGLWPQLINRIDLISKFCFFFLLLNTKISKIWLFQFNSKDIFLYISFNIFGICSNVFGIYCLSTEKFDYCAKRNTYTHGMNEWMNIRFISLNWILNELCLTLSLYVCWKFHFFGREK